MTDEEKLCAISEVLRRHNKIHHGISHAEALRQITNIIEQSPRHNKAFWLPIGRHMAYVCSNCKFEYMTTFDICPNCEAYMTKGDEK